MYRNRNYIRSANFAINPMGYGAIAGSVLGGAGGALSADPNASWQDRLGRGALGAGIGAGIGGGAGYGGNRIYRGNRLNELQSARAARPTKAQVQAPLNNYQNSMPPFNPHPGQTLSRGNNYSDMDRTMSAMPPFNPHPGQSIREGFSDIDRTMSPMPKFNPTGTQPTSPIPLNGYQNTMPRSNPYAESPANARSMSYGQGGSQVPMTPITPRMSPTIQPQAVQVANPNTVPSGTGFNPNAIPGNTPDMLSNIQNKGKQLGKKGKPEWMTANSSFNAESLASFYSKPRNYRQAYF